MVRHKDLKNFSMKLVPYGEAYLRGLVQDPAYDVYLWTATIKAEVGEGYFLIEKNMYKQSGAGSVENWCKQQILHSFREREKERKNPDKYIM